MADIKVLERGENGQCSSKEERECARLESVKTVTVADPRVDPHGAKEPPFGLDLVLRSTDDRLNGTTLSG